MYVRNEDYQIEFTSFQGYVFLFCGAVSQGLLITHQNAVKFLINSGNFYSVYASSQLVDYLTICIMTFRLLCDRMHLSSHQLDFFPANLC